MHVILSYIRQYFRQSGKALPVLTTLLAAILVFINYHFGIDARLSEQPGFFTRFAGRYAVYLIAFGIPYVYVGRAMGSDPFRHRAFILLLFLAPAIFSLKAGLGFSFEIAEDASLNRYWNAILYWPLLLLLVGSLVYACWRIFSGNQPFYGITKGNINWKPYWIMLLLMVPLVALASTRPDFQDTYPKFQSLADDIGSTLNWWQVLLFELSYGSDFISIEFFFRGFLVLAFARWAGIHAVLPMACFYCTIHFGKPLGECISSYFGGLLLGIIVYHTRSIWGGLVVHLGIAWLMELAGAANT